MLSQEEIDRITAEVSNKKMLDFFYSSLKMGWMRWPYVIHTCLYDRAIRAKPKFRSMAELKKVLENDLCFIDQYRGSSQGYMRFSTNRTPKGYMAIIADILWVNKSDETDHNLVISVIDEEKKFHTKIWKLESLLVTSAKRVYAQCHPQFVKEVAAKFNF
jgi:hypothetical protein